MGLMKRQGARLAAFRSVIFYAGFGVMTPIFALLVLLFWPLPYGVRESTARVWCRCVLLWLRLTCGVRHRIRGLENLPAGPAVILSNHQSTWETIAFRTVFPARLSWIIKRSLFRIPFYGWSLKALEEIGIDRDAGREALRQIEQDGSRHLAAGRWVVVFPEGTRLAPDQSGRYGQGGARLANAAGVPVVPVALDSGWCWPNDDWRKYPGTITLEIGPVVETEGRSTAEVNRMTRDWIETARGRIGQATAATAMSDAAARQSEAS
jgi:1-acyl-sn-glycerol-3-phosphate acyltransferase